MPSSSQERVVAVIPARMDSSRFPGKPLASILGLPMIEHVCRRMEMCQNLDSVYVATCDQEIFDATERIHRHVAISGARTQGENGESGIRDLRS